MRGDSDANATEDEIHAELIVRVVTGHAQMAMKFLGRPPNPQAGAHETSRPEAAKIYVDQLGMLQAKPRGNLSAGESKPLNDMLMATHGAFAEALDAQVTDREGAPPAA